MCIFLGIFAIPRDKHEQTYLFFSICIRYALLTRKHRDESTFVV